MQRLCSHWFCCGPYDKNCCTRNLVSVSFPGSYKANEEKKKKRLVVDLRKFEIMSQPSPITQVPSETDRNGGQTNVDTQINDDTGTTTKTEGEMRAEAFFFDPQSPHCRGGCQGNRSSTGGHLWQRGDFFAVDCGANGVRSCVASCRHVHVCKTRSKYARVRGAEATGCMVRTSVVNTAQFPVGQRGGEGGTSRSNCVSCLQRPFLKSRRRSKETGFVGLDWVDNSCRCRDGAQVTGLEQQVASLADHLYVALLLFLGLKVPDGRST
jgi:hypothetical protein